MTTVKCEHNFFSFGKPANDVVYGWWFTCRRRGRGLPKFDAHTVNIVENDQIEHRIDATRPKDAVVDY